MKPDLHLVRAASGAVSNVEALWKGLPSQITMRSHVQALQKALSEMLPEVPRHQREEVPDFDDAPTPAGKPRKIYWRAVRPTIVIAHPPKSKLHARQPKPQADRRFFCQQCCIYTRVVFN